MYKLILDVFFDFFFQQYEAVATEGNEALLHHMEVFHCVGDDEDEEFPIWSGPCGSDSAPKPLQVRKISYLVFPYSRKIKNRSTLHDTALWIQQLLKINVVFLKKIHNRGEALQAEQRSSILLRVSRRTDLIYWPNARRGIRESAAHVVFAGNGQK